MASEAQLLDETNRRILEELQADARLSMAELGRRVSLSPPAVADRVQRLERAGVITGYHATVDPKAIGFPIAAVVRVRPASRQLHKIPEVAREIPEVVECYRITGEDCFFVKLHLRAMEDLEADPRPLRPLRADDHLDRPLGARRRGRFRWSSALFSARKGGDAIATKEEKLELEGEVVEAFPNGMFKITLDTGQDVLGYTAGKMRRYRIRINPGDRVKVEVSPVRPLARPDRLPLPLGRTRLGAARGPRSGGRPAWRGDARPPRAARPEPFARRDRDAASPPGSAPGSAPPAGATRRRTSSPSACPGWRRPPGRAAARRSHAAPRRSPAGREAPTPASWIGRKTPARTWSWRRFTRSTSSAFPTTKPSRQPAMP